MKDVGNVTASDVGGWAMLPTEVARRPAGGVPFGKNVAMCGAKFFLVAAVAVCARFAASWVSQLA